MAGMMSKVVFAGKVPVILKATSDDTNATPGYLYEEVSKITYESLEFCDHLADYLAERLKKQSLNVKLKVLLVIKNVLLKGHVEFGKVLRKNADGIREAKTIFGPLDPLLGETPYLNIRQAASDVLQLLYDVDRERENVASRAGSGTGAAPLHSKSVGFGKAVLEPSQGESESGIFDGIFQKLKDSIPVSLKPAMGTPVEQTSKYEQFIDRSESFVTQPSSTFFLGTDRTSVLPSSNYKSPSSLPLSNRSAVDWPAKLSEANNNSRSTSEVASIQSDAKKVDLFAVEEKLVEDISIPSGVRTQPTRQELDAFVKRCHTLDSKAIISNLNLRLSCQDSRVQLRVMFVLEELLRSSIPDISALVIDGCTDNLMLIRQKTNSQTRNKASKLLELLDSTHHEGISADGIDGASTLDGTQTYVKRLQSAGDAMPYPCEAAAEDSNFLSLFQDLTLKTSNSQSKQIPAYEPVPSGSSSSLLNFAPRTTDTFSPPLSVVSCNDLDFDPFASQRIDSAQQHFLLGSSHPMPSIGNRRSPNASDVVMTKFATSENLMWGNSVDSSASTERNMLSMDSAGSSVPSSTNVTTSSFDLADFSFSGTSEAASCVLVEPIFPSKPVAQSLLNFSVSNSPLAASTTATLSAGGVDIPSCKSDLSSNYGLTPSVQENKHSVFSFMGSSFPETPSNSLMHGSAASSARASSVAGVSHHQYRAQLLEERKASQSWNVGLPHGTNQIGYAGVASGAAFNCPDLGSVFVSSSQSAQPISALPVGDMLRWNRPQTRSAPIGSATPHFQHPPNLRMIPVRQSGPLESHHAAFTFMAADPSQKKPVDAFSFVSEAMAASRKKK